MLCQYCNEKEAYYTFFVNFDNQISQVRLCAECTEKMREEFQDFYRNWKLYLGNPREASPQEEGSPFFSPFSFDGNTRELGDDPFPLDAGEEIKQKRQMEELRVQMEKAVQVEDYEKAALLRDEIASMKATAEPNCSPNNL